jgi:hypothetical protein
LEEVENEILQTRLGAKMAAKMSEEECETFIGKAKELCGKAAIVCSEATAGKRRLNNWLADESTVQ